MFDSMFDELKAVNYNAQHLKEIKRLKSLQVKADAYLEPKRACMMELCEYT